MISVRCVTVGVTGVISTQFPRAPVLAPWVANEDFMTILLFVTASPTSPRLAYTSPLLPTSRSAARPVANASPVVGFIKGAPNTCVHVAPPSVERCTPLEVEVKFRREAYKAPLLSIARSWTYSNVRTSIGGPGITWTVEGNTFQVVPPSIVL